MDPVLTQWQSADCGEKVPRQHPAVGSQLLARGSVIHITFNYQITTNQINKNIVIALHNILNPRGPDFSCVGPDWSAGRLLTVGPIMRTLGSSSVGFYWWLLGRSGLGLTPVYPATNRHNFSTESPVHLGSVTSCHSY